MINGKIFSGRGTSLSGLETVFLKAKRSAYFFNLCIGDTVTASVYHLNEFHIIC